MLVKDATLAREQQQALPDNYEWHSTRTRGDSSGDSAHQRWLALVSARPSKTRINWRSLALAGASRGPDKREVGGSSPPRPIRHKSKSCCTVHSRTFSLDHFFAGRGDNYGDTVTTGVTEWLRRHI